MRFQERLQLAFARERARRKGLGQPLLMKTDLWKAAGLSSGAVSHWFRGGNDADLASCIKVAPCCAVTLGGSMTVAGQLRARPFRSQRHRRRS